MLTSEVHRRAIYLKNRAATDVHSNSVRKRKNLKPDATFVSRKKCE
jgi:hypothetical protein